MERERAGMEGERERGEGDEGSERKGGAGRERGAGEKSE